MEQPKLMELSLIPAPDDCSLLSSEYQEGLRGFADSLETEGRVAVEAKLLDAASGGGPIMYGGVFALDAVSPQVRLGLTAWLQDRSGRQVRVGVGPEGRRPTAEAHTAEEVERYLSKAEEYIEIMRQVEAPQLDLRLIPGVDDAPQENSAYQQDLEQFEEFLNSQGLEVSRLIRLRESADGGPTMGDFVIRLAGIVGPVLARLLEPGFTLNTAAKSA